MSDTQRSKLFLAEEAVWDEDRSLTADECEKLVAEFNRATRGIVRLHLLPGEGHCKLQGGALWVPPWAMRPLVIIHELAHTLIWSRFPAHGAEFAARYVELVRALESPYLAERLTDEFSDRHVHFTPDERRQRTRREVVNFANCHPGALLEVLVDEPPELLVGPVGEVVDGAVEIGDDLVELHRLRYVNHLAAHAA